jgi:nicotinamide-nucleotide amidase
MKAHILTIGDELLLGQTTNTNAAWLGDQLSRLGIDVVRSSVVGDEARRIEVELDRAFAEVELVVTTGGLGPTHDDVTKTVVADYFGRSLAVDEALLERVRNYYERRNRQAPPSVERLAEVPEGFALLQNEVGTAAGLWHETDEGRAIAVLPGVPPEMKSIFRAAVRPRLEDRQNRRAVTHRTLRTTGIGESDLQEEIGDLSDQLDDRLRLAYLPSTSGVRLRLSAYGENAEARLDRLEQTLRERAGLYIYGTEEDELEAVLGDMLRDRGLTVASAESCTGGLVAHRLTNVSGSSDYFIGSVVSYANGVKVNHLGVDEAALQAHGAVSEPVARQMAAGVRRALGTDIGVATTGIAGPTGGTPEKPVGTVWLGYADADTTRAVRLQFLEDRALNKELFSTSALDLIRRQLLRRDGDDVPAADVHRAEFPEADAPASDAAR